MSLVGNKKKVVSLQSNVWRECFFVFCSGKEFVMRINNQECTVAILLEELYKKAASSGLWSLVRHAAGMLHKRVEDLGPVSTLLQISLGVFVSLLFPSPPPFPPFSLPPSSPFPPLPSSSPLTLSTFLALFLLFAVGCDRPPRQTENCLLWPASQ